ncbi:MAG: hypothetical protein PVH73_00755 [Candidatus Bathyarchaeota archaeon]|jgi:hypothetical protein
MSEQHYDFIKSVGDYQGCDRVCLTHLKLQEEKKKNYILKKNLEVYQQDMKNLIKKMGLVFALNLYIDRINELDLVEAVYYIEKEELVDIWTFIRENDLNVEERIAEAQCELMRIHNELDLDFMVYPLYEQNLQNVLPNNSIKVFPENELR